MDCSCFCCCWLAKCGVDNLRFSFLWVGLRFAFVRRKRESQKYFDLPHRKSKLWNCERGRRIQQWCHHRSISWRHSPWVRHHQQRERSLPSQQNRWKVPKTDWLPSFWDSGDVHRKRALQGIDCPCSAQLERKQNRVFWTGRVLRLQSSRVHRLEPQSDQVPADWFVPRLAELRRSRRDVQRAHRAPKGPFHQQSQISILLRMLQQDQAYRCLCLWSSTRDEESHARWKRLHQRKVQLDQHLELGGRFGCQLYWNTWRLSFVPLNFYCNSNFHCNNNF